MNKTHIINTTFILVLISLGYFATDIYVPSLPSLAEYFGATENQTQLTLFSYMLSFSFTPLIFGPLSDYIGRKKVIVAGMIISIFSTLSCLFAASIHWMIASRFVQGVGTGAIMIAARSMVVDLHSGVALARQISLISMFMPLVLAIAPTIGGVLQEGYGWHAVFLFLAGFLTLVFASFVYLEESNKTLSKKTVREVFSGYKDVLQNIPFLLCGLGMILPTIGLFAYLTASPFIFQEVIGLSPAEYGMLAIFIGGTIMLSSFINSRMLSILPVNALIGFGTALMTTGGALMMGFHFLGICNTWTVLAPTLLFFTCIPFCIGNSASKAMSTISSHFGSANGLLSSSQFLAGAMGSLAFSIIEDSSAFPLALCFFLLGIANGVILYVSIYKKKIL